MQGIALVNDPNANVNASVNARNKQIFIFLSSHLRSLPTRVNRQKLNHCRSSCKNTSIAFAYLYFLAFALDVSDRLHFYLRLHLLLLRTCEPVFRSFHGMTYL